MSFRGWWIITAIVLIIVDAALFIVPLAAVGILLVGIFLPEQCKDWVDELYSVQEPRSPE